MLPYLLHRLPLHSQPAKNIVVIIPILAPQNGSRGLLTSSVITGVLISDNGCVSEGVEVRPVRLVGRDVAV